MFELIVTLIACGVGIVLVAATLNSVVKGYNKPKETSKEEQDNKESEE